MSKIAKHVALAYRKWKLFYPIHKHLGRVKNMRIKPYEWTKMSIRQPIGRSRDWLPGYRHSMRFTTVVFRIFNKSLLLSSLFLLNLLGTPFVHIKYCRCAPATRPNHICSWIRMEVNFASFLFFFQRPNVWISSNRQKKIHCNINIIIILYAVTPFAFIKMDLWGMGVGVKTPILHFTFA